MAETGPRWSERVLGKTSGRFRYRGFDFKGFRGLGAGKWWLIRKYWSYKNDIFFLFFRIFLRKKNLGKPKIVVGNSLRSPVEGRTAYITNFGVLRAAWAARAARRLGRQSL